MVFHDDTTDDCNFCGKPIEAGKDYYCYKGKNYCSESCLGGELIEENAGEITELHLNSADDNAGNYYDVISEEKWVDLHG